MGQRSLLTRPARFGSRRVRSADDQQQPRRQCSSFSTASSIYARFSTGNNGFSTPVRRLASGLATPMQRGPCHTIVFNHSGESCANLISRWSLTPPRWPLGMAPAPVFSIARAVGSAHLHITSRYASQSVGFFKAQPATYSSMRFKWQLRRGKSFFEC